MAESNQDLNNRHIRIQGGALYHRIIPTIKDQKDNETK